MCIIIKFDDLDVKIIYKIATISINFNKFLHPCVYEAKISNDRPADKRTEKLTQCNA